MATKIDISTRRSHNENIRMWIISPRRLKEFQARHKDSSGPLGSWLKIVQHTSWRNLAELRKDYPHADLVIVKSGKPVIVFNVGGNKYRLITAIHFNTRVVYVLRVMTHVEYDRKQWKDQL